MPQFGYFFEDKDMLPVQTLAAAAHEILFVLSGKKPRGNLLKGTWFIKPDMKKRWHDKVHAIPNFLKHAAKDVTKTEEFYPDVVEFWIFDCILMHDSMGNERTREIIVFLVWIMAEHPDMFNFEAFGPGVARVVTVVKQIGAISKSAAYDFLIDPVAYPIHALATR